MSSENLMDCTIVGASFAGLACASALAQAGLRVTVMEKKRDAGEKLHTTGIIVKDAIDQVALLDGLPAELVRRIGAVRLYAPNLRHVDLAAPGYYFLATDTPQLMRWLAAEAERAGARIAYRQPFERAQRLPSGFDLGESRPYALSRRSRRARVRRSHARSAWNKAPDSCSVSNTSMRASISPSQTSCIALSIVVSRPATSDGFCAVSARCR